MSCARFADAILDHALGEPATPELLGHLPGCAECRGALVRERRLVSNLDGELHHAFEVSPSPALLPRVRQAVGTPRAQSAWSWSRLLPIAAGLAAVATLLVLRGRPEAVPQEPITPAIAVAPRPDPSSPSVAVPAAVPVPVLRPATVLRKPPEPEVLVPPGEAELLARYAAAVRAQRVEAAPVGVEDARSQELVVPLLQQIAPLEVKSLADVNSEGVDHE